MPSERHARTIAEAMLRDLDPLRHDDTALQAVAAGYLAAEKEAARLAAEVRLLRRLSGLSPLTLAVVSGGGRDE